MSEEIEYYKHLASIMLRTRGTRFTAAQRLVTSERFSVLTLASLSVFLTAVSVVLLSAPDALGIAGARYFGALSVVASVWILVITLFDYALGRSIHAHRLHQNAIRITKIAREMERELARSDPNMDRVRDLAARYEDENAETEVNHTSVDYRIYTYSKEIPTAPISALWFPIRNFIFKILAFCMSVPSNLFVLCVVVGATVWYFTAG